MPSRIIPCHDVSIYCGVGGQEGIGVKTATTGVLRLALGQREDPSPVIAFSNLGSAFSEN